MNLADLVTNPELLSSYLDGVSFEPWKQLTGEAQTIAISSVSASQVIILKGDNLCRLAYPLNTTYKRGGKIRATFAITSKTAQALLKLESALKDRLGSSGMCKKTDLKTMFQSSIAAPTAKYPSHTASFDLRVDAPKTTLYQQVENPETSGWNTMPIDFSDIAKFSLMSLRVSPSLVWKGNGKVAIKMMLKQAIVAYEEEIPPSVDEVRDEYGCRVCFDVVLRVYFILPEDDWLTPRSLCAVLADNWICYFGGPNSPRADDPDLLTFRPPSMSSGTTSRTRRR